MKRYFVLVHTKRCIFRFTTNSLELARWIADLKMWRYAKIHDQKASDEDLPWSKCIYIRTRES